MATTARAGDGPMTAEQLMEFGDDTFTELVDGVLVMMTPAGGAHGSVATRLLAALGPHVYDRDVGELFDSSTGFILRRDPDTVRSPDVAFVARARMAAVPRRGFLELAPDLAVEILSPSNSWRELARRLSDYFDAGTRAVWVIDPETRTVAVHLPDTPASGPQRIVGSEVLDGGEVLPGFTMPVARLFAGLAPAEDAPPSATA